MGKLKHWWTPTLNCNVTLSMESVVSCLSHMPRLSGISQTPCSLPAEAHFKQSHTIVSLSQSHIQQSPLRQIQAKIDFHTCFLTRSAELLLPCDLVCWVCRPAVPAWHRPRAFSAPNAADLAHLKAQAPSPMGRASEPIATPDEPLRALASESEVAAPTEGDKPSTGWLLTRCAWKITIQAKPASHRKGQLHFFKI